MNERYCFHMSIFIFFQEHFHLTDFNERFYDLTNESIAKPFKAQLSSAVYLQVSTISQALIFVTRSRGWSFTERPGLLLVAAFIIAQLVSTVHKLVRISLVIYIYICKCLYSELFPHSLQLYSQLWSHQNFVGSKRLDGVGLVLFGCLTL